MTAIYRVLIADKIAADGLAPLRDDPRFELITAPGLSLAELTQALVDVDAVIVRSAAKVPREALAATSRLKVIGRAGVGVDTIDVPAATEHGIAVLNAPAGNTISAAELTMALMLSVAAISRVEYPSAISLSTSSSRGVRMVSGSASPCRARYR